MRISPESRFPYPVLAANTTDYGDSEFSVELRVTEEPSTGRVTVHYVVHLDQPEIKGEVDRDRAQVGVFITCQRTYYNSFHPVTGSKGELAVDRGSLRGEVVLRPMITVSAPIDGFRPSGLHPEFGSDPWEFAPGQVLAYGDESIIDVGLDKLTPLETIFTLEQNSSVPEGETRVDPGPDKIAILASPGTFRAIHSFRGTRGGRSVLLNAVYLPAVMTVLGAIRTGDHKGARWYRTLSAKCNQLGIDLESGAPVEGLADAQALLKSPLKRLLNSTDLEIT